MPNKNFNFNLELPQLFIPSNMASLQAHFDELYEFLLIFLIILHLFFSPKHEVM